MSGLDEKAVLAACEAYHADLPTHDYPSRWAMEQAIRAYLAAATPADVGELVERLRLLVAVIDPLMIGGRDSRLLTEAATALERVTRERDEAHLRTAYLEEEVVRTRDAAVERVRTAEAKLAEALARLETVEAETRELRARNDPMRVLGDPRVGVTIDEASLKELKRVLATIGGATP